MTLYLDGMEVTSVHWYRDRAGDLWARYTATNAKGNGVGGTCSAEYWLAHTVETDDNGQALLASPDGEAFAAQETDNERS